MTSPGILQRIEADSAYQAGVEWGAARLGHPEGKIRLHIAQLERNLDRISDLLAPEDVSRLRLLIHTHDTFKFQAGEEVPVASSRSHAALAARFLSKYTDDPDVIAVARFHDSPFASWCDYAYRGDTSLNDFRSALAGVKNRELLFTFMLIDGLTEGKHTAPLEWALGIFEREGALRWPVREMLTRLAPNSRNYREGHSPALPLSMQRKFAGIEYRSLGPVEPWGADIYLSERDLPRLRPLLQNLADSTGRRYSGVVVPEDGLIRFHLSRYPRRANQEVPPLADYKDGFARLLGAFAAAEVSVLGAQEEEPFVAPGLQRATIGLVEGYCETRKRSIVTLISEGKFSCLADAQQAVAKQLGDLGPGVSGAMSLDELAKSLSALDLAATHSRREAEELAGGRLRLQFGRILSVAPGNYLYEEPCVIAAGSGREARKAIFDLAVKFKQARFTFESLTARETINIELPQFCREAAASI